MIYEAPAMYAEAFAPNQYVAACKDPGYQLKVDPMTVRCQTYLHNNTAMDVVFFEGNTSCTGAYNPTYGGGFVQGVWDKGLTYSSTSGTSEEVDWFYEDNNGNGEVSLYEAQQLSGQGDKNYVASRYPNFGDLVTAFLGWFDQDGNKHKFYAKVTKEIDQYNLS